MRIHLGCDSDASLFMNQKNPPPHRKDLIGDIAG